MVKLKIQVFHNNVVFQIFGNNDFHSTQFEENPHASLLGAFKQLQI
jgi:hypothetical protein